MTMWDIDQPPSGHLNNVVVSPTDTLYEFDEPLIFRSTVGLVDMLFNKVLQNQGKSIYLACQTDDRTVDALRSGRLSVAGAFDRKSYWIVALDDDLRIAAYWNKFREEIPKRFFAKPGLGLYHWHGVVPDSLEQSYALLAIKFKGADLTEAGIPLGKLKNLVDKSFATFRKLLTPTQLINTKSSTFDVEVAAPKLSSLVIAVKEPVINMQAVRRIKALDKYSKGDIESAVRTKGEQFAQKLLEIQEVSRNRALGGAYAEENFAYLDILSDILPDEDGFISSVEFNGLASGGLTTVVFDRDAAGSIRQTLEAVERREITEHGMVNGLITSSQTIRLRSVRGKDVTCVFSKELYEALLADPNFRVKGPISLTGQLTRRKKIDFMTVNSFRTIARTGDLFI
ncbi:hypothetical protein [Rhizobium leguminosarum]|uniref:hypothetical protein n=1 Tax=Rhizobium leguminosarum TaxID=384 RepID=UPI001039553F|nr:hypothetical protein [Rhizobium leguminosarum]TBZ07830.1 hypothetical protein E0H33_29445 [Rhizobium leguminosarum bv. viciae]